MKSNSEGLIIDGIAAFIDRDNIDTDQIIPTEYLKSINEIQGILALENSFNKVGLDHVILVKVASTAVQLQVMCLMESKMSNLWK